MCICGGGREVKGEYATFSFADSHRKGVVVVGAVLGLPVKHGLGLGGDVGHTPSMLL